MADPLIKFRPQEGPQASFLSCSADIAIYGGSAGGGKTFGLLLDALRYVEIKDYCASIFRRTTPEIKNPGALWDESIKLYSIFPNAEPIQHTLEWHFPLNARIKFSHMEHEKDKFGWQGAQIPYIGFDELTHFTKSQFFYMLSRNRSTCGVMPIIRATCNPDPDSWVKDFISWWLDENGEYADPVKAGKVRWFININDNIIWADTKEELIAKHKDCIPKSVAFIPARLSDNKKLMEADPGYLANLMALPLVERERLLNGNWKIRPMAGNIFKRDWFEIVDAIPEISNTYRAWDLAGSKDAGDYTASVKISKTANGIYYITDMFKFQGTPLEVENSILNTASQDGREVRISLPQDPGQAGKAQAEQLIRKLAGYIVKSTLPSGSKVTRASAFSAQAQAGNIKLLRGSWNNMFIDELINFPDGKYDDVVDAASDAFNNLAQSSEVRIRYL